MTTIPFIVIVCKPNKHKMQSTIITDVGKDLDDIKNKIVYIMQEEISVFDDIPDDYHRFISDSWYNEMSADIEPFEYKIFYENKWIKPWSIEEIYDTVCDVLHKLLLLGSYIDSANNVDDE